MKLKYYLRGLGAGILFSVLVFVFVVGPKESEISDEEIIQRAKQLGMVEEKDNSIDMEKLRGQSDDAKLSPTEKPTPTPTPGYSPTPVLTPTDVPSSTEAPTPTEVPDLPGAITLTPSPTLIPTPTEALQETDTEQLEEKTALVEIKSGMRSEDICAVLQSAGLIEDAMSLNAYLIQNGYAERLRSGQFELNSTMTFEEIAERLTW